MPRLGEVYLGPNPVSKLYLGASTVWEPEPDVEEPELIDPVVETGSLYKGPITIDLDTTAEQVIILFQYVEWGDRANIPMPSGGSDVWDLIVENEVESDVPMLRVFAGVAESTGSTQITLPAFDVDTWHHGHAYVFPAGSAVVASDTADGSATFGATAPSVHALEGDVLVCAVGKSYHGGAVDFQVPEGMQGVETDPEGEYSSFATAWERIEADGDTNTRAFVTLPNLAGWTAASVVVRQASSEGFSLALQPMQPAGIVYSDTVDLNGYDQAGALLIAGRENYQDPEFAEAITAGASVLIYVDAIIDNPTGHYHDLLHNDSEFGPATDLWPGEPEANEWGNLVDFRVGSVLLDQLEAVLELIVDENPGIAGFFADDLGSRSYFPSIDWGSWSADDQQSYREGALAVARVFRTVCDRHGLIFMVNGTWNRGTVAANGGGYPDPGVFGCSLADGGVMENWDGFDPDYRAQYAAGPQWATGSRRTRGDAVMLAIASQVDDKNDWASLGTVAYTALQADYGNPGPAWGSFHPTGLNPSE